MRERITSSIQPKSITQIIRAIEASENMTSRKAMDMILAAKVDEEHLAPYVRFNHSSDEGFGKVSLYKGSSFEVFLKCWRPGDYTAIHDTGMMDWGAMKVFGNIDHYGYQLEGDKMSIKSMIKLNERNILGISGDAIHQMGNPSNKNVVSLHIYGANAEYSPNIWQDMNIFDITKKMRHVTDDGGHFELSDHQIRKSEFGLESDFPTWLNNLIMQINRNKKMGRFNRLKDLLFELRSTDRRSLLVDYLEGKLDESGEFINHFDKKKFATSIIGLGNFLGEYPEYHPTNYIKVQQDKSQSVFIVTIEANQMILDYSHDKLVMS